MKCCTICLRLLYHLIHLTQSSDLYKYNESASICVYAAFLYFRYPEFTQSSDSEFRLRVRSELILTQCSDSKF